MKLRKAAGQALLDLDDPLESSDESSDYDSSEDEYVGVDGGLWDVAEEDENEGDEEEGEKEGHMEPGLDGVGDDTLRIADSDPAGGGSGAFGPDTVLANHSSDGGSESGKDEQEVDNEVDAGTDHLAAAAFNPFDLLAADCSDSGNDNGGLGDGDDDAVTVESDVGPDEVTQQGEEMQCRRRQRRKPRRRRRRGTVAPAAGRSGAAGAGGHATEAGEHVGPSAAASVGSMLECIAPPATGEEEDRARHTVESDDDGDSDSDQRAGAECWLCYGEGHVASCGLSKASSSSGQVLGGASCESRVALGGDGCGGCDELVAPCRVCSGGVRYIHRRCFQQWLDSSWAIACPNCRTLYDSAVLDDHTDGSSVRAMLVASCPPNHDLRQPLPPRALVHFCVGGTVELSMACGGFTAVELLRRIRLLVDDMAAHGGDGGLGLVGEDGRTLELLSFDVTALVLDLGLDAPLPSRDETDAGHPSRNGRRNPTYGYEDSEDEDFFDDSEDDSVDIVGGPRWDGPLMPPAGLRERSFTGGNRGGLIRRYIRPVLAPHATQMAATVAPGLQQQFGLRPLPRWSEVWPERMFGPHLQRMPDDIFIDWIAPAAWVAERPEGHPRGAAMRMEADRAVQRAEQQRRRADMLLQQRSQQRQSAGSRAQQTMPAASRGTGGRRR